MVHELVIEIKNGYSAGKEKVVTSHSKMRKAVVDILKKERYIDDYEIIKKDKKKYLKLKLLFENESPAITSVKIISKPGRRIYRKAKEMKPVLAGLGIAVLSTPEGIMTDKQARKKNIGGEELFRIW